MFTSLLRCWCSKRVDSYRMKLAVKYQLFCGIGFSKKMAVSGMKMAFSPHELQPYKFLVAQIFIGFQPGVIIFWLIIPIFGNLESPPSTQKYPLFCLINFEFSLNL